MSWPNVICDMPLNLSLLQVLFQFSLPYLFSSALFFKPEVF